jgi:predicted site-specific integrase-resolvase
MAEAVGEITTDKGDVVKGDFLPLKDVAKRVKVNPATILRWLKKKRVEVTAFKDYRGRWMFQEKDVQVFINYTKRFQQVKAK